MKPFAMISVISAAGLLAGSIAAAQSVTGERPRAVLFDGVSFGGAPQPIVLETPNLGAHGFDNRASSIDIRIGQWQVCTDRGFAGRCEILEPGRHNLSALGLDNLISSMRPVTEENEEIMVAPLVLHSKKNFDGDRKIIETDQSDLSAVTFDNAARSITINSGVWEVCSEPDFRGTCSYMRGSEPNLGAIGLAKKVSSLRKIEQLKSPEEYAVVVYPERNHEGAYRGLDTDMRQLSEISFDDRARSIVINSGEWLVCDQPNYLGRCEVLSTSVKDLRRLKLSSAISSIRRYDKPAHEPDNRITRDEFRAIGLTTDYYVAPTKNGVRINYCDPDGNCGLIAANAFCVSRGHSSSRHFVADPAAEETVYVSGKPACQGKSCQALSDVLCAK